MEALLDNEDELNKEMAEMQQADLEEPTPEAKLDEPKEEVKEAVKEELPQEEVKEDQKEKHWAINAMHEERMRRKELQDKIEKMEERFQKIVEKSAEPEKKVSYDENPAEYLKSEVETLKSHLNESGLTPQQINERRAAQEKQQQFYNEFTQSETLYQNEVSDYQDAVKYLYDARINEYKVMGYSDQQAFQLTQKDAWQIAQDAMSRGQNGPEVFYNLAKNRGYSKKTETPSEVEKLKEVSKTLEDAKSLGSAGDTPGELSLSDLASLSDDEFDKLTQGENWRKAMGG